MLQTSPSPLTDGDKSALFNELLALNAELEVLHSSSFALRAYIETWVSFVGLSVAAKLTWDWWQSVSNAPVFAIPLALMGVSVGADAIVQRRRQRALAQTEKQRLERQLELRRALGIGELKLP